MRQLDATGMKRLHRSWRSQPIGPLRVIMEAISGPYNLGSVIRTAAAYRVDHLYLAASQLTPKNNKVQKTALGTDRYLPWTSSATIEESAALARTAGARLIGVELTDESQPIHLADLSGSVAMVMGHEDRGLSKTALGLCDEVVYFPQLGKVGSLNLATATSMAIWEVRRQGWTADPDGPASTDPMR